MNPVIEAGAKAIAAVEYADEGHALESSFAATVHGGDCTNEPHTCPVCLANTYRDYAKAALRAALEAAGAVHLRDGYPDSIQSDGFGTVVRAAYGERGDAE